MLYFAFGSNLYQKQMKRRCKDSKYVCCHKLKNYKLAFRHFYYGGGVADVERKKNSTVLGAIYRISKRDEKKLDVYEDFPTLYKKYYFYYYGKKVMTYTMTKKTPFRYPTTKYLNIVKRGYEDCKLKSKNLIKALKD
jgi:gamma-glutamylcyclotransferase (GGCT)/AIG2-like uncharacterized protein YtfP